MDVLLNNTAHPLLLLLKASLQGAQPHLHGPVDWQQLFNIARQHGVVTLLYDAILKLPPDRQPQGNIALSWALSAERTRHHFAHQAEVLHTLALKASEAHLPILILKGADLAQLYPVPDSRACGDIDLHFFHRYNDGNALLGNSDATLDGKHSEFRIDGVTVENHLTLLDQDYRSQRLAEQFIQSTLHQAQQDADGLFHLPPVGNMVYLLMHTVSHLTAKYKMPLRNILDWGLFLDANQHNLPPDQCRPILRHIGMTPAFNILTSLAAEFTGRDLGGCLLGPVRDSDRTLMRQLILHKDYLPHVPPSLSFAEQLRLRISRYRSRHWLYPYLPQNRTERLLNTLRQQYRKLTRQQ